MRQRRLFILGIVLALAAVVASALPAPAADPVYPAFRDIGGLPLHAVTAPGSAIGVGPDGQPWLYLVSSGTPAVLSVVDATTGARVHEFPLPGAAGSWAVDVTPDGDVYVGTYSGGKLFRWTPGSDTVDDLGVAVPGETFIWSITHDETGAVYGGTGQNGAHVFRHDPVTGATSDLGSLAPGADPLIVRGIGAANGKVYAGTSATAGVYEIDVATGSRRDLGLPAGADPAIGVYDVAVRGDLLFVRFSASGSPAPLHVYDLGAGAWTQSIDAAHGLFVTPVADDGRTVYFVRDETLHTYDLVDRTWAPTALTGVSDMRGFGFLDLGDPDWPGDSVLGVDFRGGYIVYSPQTGRSESRTADAVAAPATIRSFAEGPDGRLYAGSFLAGGLAGYDPGTGATTEFAPEVGQAESIVTHDGALYVGTYPRAEILRYDPAQPASPGTNPEPVLSLYDEHGQSRPFAMASAGDHLAIGTVAKNGSPGGGLAILDTRTGEHWFDDVVPGQSVVALAHRDGVLYGATSVFGGVGGPRPTQSDAVVFAYDLQARRTLWQVVPVPGEGAIGEIGFDADGKLWSHTPVSVFRLDVETQTVEARRTYEPYPWETVDYIHVGSRLWIDPYLGTIYVVTQGAVYTIDPASLNRSRVFRPASIGFLHNNGDAFLARDARVWEYTSSARPAAVASVAHEVITAGSQQTLTVTGLGAGELVEIWERPRARLLDSVRADPSGTLTSTFTVEPVALGGAAAVEVRRVATRNTLRADFEVTPARCDTTVTGPHRAPLTVTRGITCLDRAQVSGPLVVRSGAVLLAHDSVIRGSVSVTAASGVRLSDVGIEGPVTVTDSTGAVSITDATIAGADRLDDNAGGWTELSGSRVAGPLSCAGNSPPPIVETPNAVAGPATGQCAGLAR